MSTGNVSTPPPSDGTIPYVQLGNVASAGQVHAPGQARPPVTPSVTGVPLQHAQPRPTSAATEEDIVDLAARLNQIGEPASPAFEKFKAGLSCIPMAFAAAASFVIGLFSGTALADAKATLFCLYDHYMGCASAAESLHVERQNIMSTIQGLFPEYTESQVRTAVNKLRVELLGIELGRETNKLTAIGKELAKFSTNNLSVHAQEAAQSVQDLITTAEEHLERAQSSYENVTNLLGRESQQRRGEEEDLGGDAEVEGANDRVKEAAQYVQEAFQALGIIREQRALARDEQDAAASVARARGAGVVLGAGMPPRRQ